MNLSRIAGAAAAALLAAGGALVAAQPSRSGGTPPAPSSLQAPQTEEGVRWQSLTPEQRQTLAPLEREWPSIDSLRKQKWIALAARFKSLGPAEQARITTRMSEWARLTPAERGQARLRFEAAREVPAPDRNARWQAYQALPADARQRLAERAASAPSAGADTARRDAPPSRSSLPREAKANVVPNPATVQPRPRQVSPALVQAAPGATTTPITRRASPPPHQQTGMPKIAATPEFVNRSTLLPKRGPQAAAVTPTAVQSTPGVRVVPITKPLVLPPPASQ
ncbi:MAG TPA: DUF3106 domain-containing protein [Caldimonas sp.]|jgi:hypothetical protein|nr:DUF3106 domain-containing protein [Caldimonas sp.]HEX2542846.1 DUF3106 domain-containing protein [Caldimonas sp.]